MQMRARVLGLLLVLPLGMWGQGKPKQCVRTVVEGEVKAGESFQSVFSPGLKFLLEPIASGWIVRVISADGPREAHDYAGLATPPYRSVTPLAIGTDFSFRAQDAIGWNPRRFHYAASAAEFRSMRTLYASATGGDGKAMQSLVETAVRQPEAVLTIEDARFVPGTNDQARMASMVALHLQSTPHTEETSGASALGRIEWMRFHVAFELPAGDSAIKGNRQEKMFCRLEPTAERVPASQKLHPLRKK